MDAQRDLRRREFDAVFANLRGTINIKYRKRWSLFDYLNTQ